MWFKNKSSYQNVKKENQTNFWIKIFFSNFQFKLIIIKAVSSTNTNYYSYRQSIDNGVLRSSKGYSIRQTMRKSWSKLHKSLSQLVTEDSKSSNGPVQQMDNIKEAVLEVFQNTELPQLNLYDFHLQVNKFQK